METQILTLDGQIINIGGGILAIQVQTTIGNYIIYSSDTDIITLNDAGDSLIWE